MDSIFFCKGVQKDAPNPDMEMMMTLRFGISALALLVASPALSQELNALV